MGEWKISELSEEVIKQIVELEEISSTYNKMEREKLRRTIEELTAELKVRGLSIPSFMQE